MRRYRRLYLLLALGVLAAAGGCAVQGRCGSHECPDETALRVAVEQRFAQYPELRPPNMLYVQVHDHQVTLSGQVNTEYERRLAESVAKETDGVTTVVNLVGLTFTSR